MTTSTKKRTAITAKAVSSIAKKDEKKVKIKSDILDDLAQAISGKKKKAKKDEDGNEIVDEGFVEVLRFASDDVIGHVKDVVSTGSLALDRATGVGGLPRGRIVEVYGGEQTGKTTFAQSVVAAVQAIGGVGALYEPEYKWDRAYAKSMGVKIEDLLMIQPAAKTIEAGISAFDRAAQHWIDNQLQHIPLVFVWDSVASTSHDKEYRDTTNKEPGVPAREFRRAMRVLTGKIATAQAIMLFVNQQYEKVGGFTGGFGPKKSTYGGGGIRYHASLRIEMVYTGKLKLPNGTVVGIEGLARTFKSSLGVPRDEQYAVAYMRGFDNAWTLLEKLKEAKYVKSAGGHYTFNVDDGLGPVSWQGGFAGLDVLLKEDPALKQRMVNIYKALP